MQFQHFTTNPTAAMRVAHNLISPKSIFRLSQINMRNFGFKVFLFVSFCVSMILCFGVYKHRRAISNKTRKLIRLKTSSLVYDEGDQIIIYKDQESIGNRFSYISGKVSEVLHSKGEYCIHNNISLTRLREQIRNFNREAVDKSQQMFASHSCPIEIGVDNHNVPVIVPGYRIFMNDRVHSVPLDSYCAEFLYRENIVSEDFVSDEEVRDYLTILALLKGM